MKVNEKFKEYCDNNILPLYNKNDKGHSIDHVIYVLNRSLKFAKTISDINLDMVYGVAVYHDVGHHIDAKNHEKVSSEILLKDENLKQFFSLEQIKIMAEAVYDHRASLEYEPRTIYGKIVSSADRNVSLDIPLMRTYEYRKKHYSDNLESIIEESRQHILNKFGESGYANDKMYFKDEEYEKFLRDILVLASNKKMFRQEYIRINHLEKLIIREQIEAYEPYDKQEEMDKYQMLEFINKFDDILTRENKFGHFSASAFVVNESHTKALILHHNIFEGFVCPGGHADGEYDLLEVAKREVLEETSINVTPLYDKIFAIQTLPITGHIKKGKYVSSHIHFDLLYLFVAKDADMDKIKVLESENSEVKWIDLINNHEAELVDFIKPIYKKILKRLENGCYEKN